VFGVLDYLVFSLDGNLLIPNIEKVERKKNKDGYPRRMKRSIVLSACLPVSVVFWVFSVRKLVSIARLGGVDSFFLSS
jgi:hypothetical protein